MFQSLPESLRPLRRPACWAIASAAITATQLKQEKKSLVAKHATPIVGILMLEYLFNNTYGKKIDHKII